MSNIRIRWVTTALILVFVLVSGVMAAPYPYPGDNLTISINKTGDNFIWWWWGNSSMESAPNLTKTVFVDNYKVVDNTTMTYYVLTDINPDEKHVLELWGFNQTLNTLNTTTVCTDKTY